MEEKLKKEQEKLSKKLVLRNDFKEPRLIAGSDAVYTGNKVIYVMIVFDFDSLEKKEVKYTVMEAKMPHLKEFAGFRQAPAAVETYHKLETDPDIIMVGGAGIMHPRRLGEASQLGLLLDKPTIGVAKEQLFGNLEEDTVYDKEQQIAKMLITKEHAKPIYISPGHRINLERATEIASRMLGEKKLPIPVHEAHKYGNKIKKKIKEKGV